MSDNQNKITLIVPEVTKQRDLGIEPAGDEVFGMKDFFISKVNVKKIDVDKFKENIEGTMEKLNGILLNVGQSVSDNWKIENITIGLSVSAEGSIGIATAGVETSIDISIAPKQKS